MKVLVIHDRENVLQQVVDLLGSTSNQKLEIKSALDYRSARDFLKATIFDLVIIDLTIPIVHGPQNPDFSAAEALLKEIFEIGDLKIPGDIIGMTRDLEALSLVNVSIGGHLMATIAEDDEGFWKKQLSEKIEYSRRSAESRLFGISQQHLYDALIFTAMDKELYPYQALFELHEIPHFRGAKEFLFTDSVGTIRKGIAFSSGRSGQPSAASHAQSLISAFRPKFAVMSGYCGGVEGKVKIGDLVFFESAYAWDYGKWTEPKSMDGLNEVAFACRPNPIDICGSRAHDLCRKLVAAKPYKNDAELNRISHLAGSKVSAFEMYISQVGSGSAVVANKSITSRITGLNESIWAVDMESYGFYFAAKNTHVAKPEFLCVKSVSDFCNGEKDDNYHAVCSAISASAVHDILTKHWKF